MVLDITCLSFLQLLLSLSFCKATLWHLLFELFVISNLSYYHPAYADVLYSYIVEVCQSLNQNV